MATVVRGVILVGHGGIPKGCPQELVTKLKRLEFLVDTKPEREVFDRGVRLDLPPLAVLA